MSDEKDNSGDCNSGNYNSGNRNSGNRNSGYCNSGNYNSGNCNSGNCNSGNCNSGNCNSGDCNSGDCNSGDCNSGDCNSGDYNSGDYNSGNYNIGFFCTEDAPVAFFDVPYNGTREEAEEMIPSIELPVCCEWIPESEMTEKERADNPNYKTIGGYLKSNPLPMTESFPLAWSKLSDVEKAKWTSLPNFDAEKFLKVTGVDVRDSVAAAEPPKQITLDGVTYNLTPA